MSDELYERIERAAAVLKAVGAKEVYLFGSAAAGALRDDSDIDLAVSGLPPGSYFRAMRLARNVLQRELDLVDLDERNLFAAYLKEKGNLRRVA